jgi:hypothetical protein
VEQASKVDMLKAMSTEFASMRCRAMRFRGIMNGADPGKLDPWVDHALRSGIHCVRQFTLKLRQGADPARNAITEIWSNGQTEGQINRLKALKRAMYGRAGISLLRVRMLPHAQLLVAGFRRCQGGGACTIRRRSGIVASMRWFCNIMGRKLEFYHSEFVRNKDAVGAVTIRHRIPG